VLFCSSVSGPHNDNVFSRCKSKLIVISNEDQAHKIVPSEDCNFARIIPVYGKFYIQTTISLFIINYCNIRINQLNQFKVTPEINFILGDLTLI
jgi:hypothetical protein